MFIDEIKITRGHNINEMIFKNLFVSGPSQFVLKNMRWDFGLKIVVQ